MLNKLRGMMGAREGATAAATAADGADASGGGVPFGAVQIAARPSAAGPAHPLDRFRFAPEHALLDQLFERFNLEDIISHIVDSGEIVPLHQSLLAQQVRLTPLIAPRLFALFARVCERVSFHEATDLYVYPSDRINALALHRLGDDQPHAISLTSAAVRDMTDEELCFVLGHEIGHLHFRHYRVMTIYHMLASNEDEGGGGPAKVRQLPQLLERRLDTWSRLAELSADRVGFLAAGESIQTAVACFYKMASGLGPEHLNFDMAAFLAHLEHLEKMPRKEVMSQFSHPVTPVRARALQLYAHATGGAEGLTAVDEEVNRLTGLMEFEASTDMGIQAKQFLLAAGLLAAHADGEVTEEEQAAVVQLLLQVTGDPEGQLAGIKSAAEAERMLDDACRWLNDNAGQERFSLFGQVAHIVSLDGNLTAGERAFMMSLAARLGIPEKAAKEILHEVLSRYVRTKTGAGKIGFGFSS